MYALHALWQVSSIQYRKLDFEEFCAAAISIYQLEGMESWEQHARHAYDHFDKDGNRPIMIEELASVRSFSLFCRSFAVHVVEVACFMIYVEML